MRGKGEMGKRGTGKYTYKLVVSIEIFATCREQKFCKQTKVPKWPKSNQFTTWNLVNISRHNNSPWPTDRPPIPENLKSSDCQLVTPSQSFTYSFIHSVSQSVSHSNESYTKSFERFPPEPQTRKTFYHPCEHLCPSSILFPAPPPIHLSASSVVLFECPLWKGYSFSAWAKNGIDLCLKWSVFPNFLSLSKP